MQFTEARLLVFSDPAFIGFFLLVFCGYWLLSSLTLRKVFLLAASYAFYATWDYRFLSLILISTAVDYVAGSQLHRCQQTWARRGWLLVSLIANLGILATFKYFNFFVGSTVQFLNWLGLSASPWSLKIILPVGISFYTFQTLSYTIDIYRGKLQPTHRLLDFALFVGFFPQLVAGPIVRAIDFLPQLTRRAQFRDVPFKSSIMLFIVGLIKKSCVSDRISPVIDEVYGYSTEFTASAIVVVVLLYAVQIYCDFSGYSDMAIATARLLGFALADNFRSPYLATNLSDFWRRWHISLSTWLRDYLYIPLGGNDAVWWRTGRNLLLTMFLGGLWHGAGWNFVLWGLLHGLGLAVYHTVLRSNSKSTPWMWQVAGWLATFLFVTLLWVPFRSPDVATTWRIIQACVFWRSPGADTIEWYWIWAFIGLVLVHAVATKWPPREWILHCPDWLASLLLGTLLAGVLSFAARDVQPFIYFQF